MRRIANPFMLVRFQHRPPNLVLFYTDNGGVHDVETYQAKKFEPINKVTNEMSMQHESRMNNCALSFPCIYPVCPLSIDHARVYVVGDVLARYFRSCRKRVMFPLGFHYSGLTAHKFHRDLNSIEENDTKRIFKDVYRCHPHILKYLKQSPRNILDYYAFRTVQDLKKINVSADYEELYTTLSPQYDRFVLAFFEVYKQKNVLVKNEDNLQLDYNNEEWKNKMISWSEDISTITPQEKRALLNSANDLKNGWNILKNEGYGTVWNDGRIIDSMHDSELISLYDIVNHVSKNDNEFTEHEMKSLFEALSGNLSGDVPHKVSQVLSWLPTSLLVLEEHLKVWFIKKLYAEALLFNPFYRTNRFFVLGLGMKDGKRMSSSRGTAVLLQDLLSINSPIKTRMILLMAGGHPSSFYNYDEATITQAEKLLMSFKHFINRSLTQLLCTNELSLNDLFKNLHRDDVISRIKQKEEFLLIFNKLEKYIEDGFFRQCLIEVMTIIPKTYKKYDLEDQQSLLIITNFYIKILLGVTIIDI